MEEIEKRTNDKMTIKTMLGKKEIINETNTETKNERIKDGKRKKERMK